MRKVLNSAELTAEQQIEIIFNKENRFLRPWEARIYCNGISRAHFSRLCRKYNIIRNAGARYSKDDLDLIRSGMGEALYQAREQQERSSGTHETKMRNMLTSSINSMTSNYSLGNFF